MASYLIGEISVVSSDVTLGSIYGTSCILDRQSPNSQDTGVFFVFV